jgi:anti-sigma factor RsiW
MSMDEQLEDLLPYYALGTLTDAERADVDAYVARDPQAASRLREMMAAAAVLPAAVTPVQPRASLKRNLMNRVRAEAESRAPQPERAGFDLGQWLVSIQRRFAPALALGALALAIVAGGWGFSLNAEVARLQMQVATQAALAAQVEALKQEAAVLRGELQAQNDVIAHLVSPGALAKSIASTAAQSVAYGQLINDPNDNTTILVLSGLPQLEPGKVYQFWWIQGETPIGAETFTVDARGRAVVRVTSSGPPTDYNAMGITVEPEGGSLTPTTTPVMLGQIS